MIPMHSEKATNVDDDLTQIRKQLVALLKQRKRIATWSEKSPIDWRPTQVTHPLSEMPFTPNGAWQFIEEKLEEGEPLEEVILDIPQDKKAYVMKIDLGPSQRKLYVKLQLGSMQVIGRSFHYSEFD